MTRTTGTCRNQLVFEERTLDCVVCAYKASPYLCNLGFIADLGSLETGGFPMPNPSADSTSTYAYKPDFSFAFKDWIAGGVETLMWSFRGERDRHYRL